jgi:anaerobic ribonucleoside-triphosphate reductase activating protein
MTRISRVHYPVTALGPGRRLGVWFQGCGLACRGCLSRDTWDSADGREVTTGELVRLWQAALDDGADGLTVSGGEPCDQPESLTHLLEAASSRRGSAPADLLVYTGYELAEATRRVPRLLDLADALITGPYDVSRPTRLIWRGSANQLLHPITGLGERRYSAYLTYEPDRAPMQFATEEGGMWLIGVPPPGGLTRLERALRRRAVTLEGVSWRP